MNKLGSYHTPKGPVSILQIDEKFRLMG